MSRILAHAMQVRSAFVCVSGSTALALLPAAFDTHAVREITESPPASNYSFAFSYPAEAVGADQLREKRVVYVPRSSDGTNTPDAALTMEYLITGITYDPETRVLRVQCGDARLVLRDVMLREVGEGGVVSHDHSVGQLSAGGVATGYLIPAQEAAGLDYVVPGTITPTQILDAVELGGKSCLAVWNDLAEQTGSEFDFTRNPDDSGFTASLITIGAAANTKTDPATGIAYAVDVRTGVNLSRQERATVTDEQVTAAVPLGMNNATLAHTAFEIAEIVSATRLRVADPTGLGPMFSENDQVNGWSIWCPATGAFHEITDTIAPDLIDIDDTSDFVEEERTELRADAEDPPRYADRLTSPSAHATYDINGVYTERRIDRSDLRGERNLLPKSLPYYWTTDADEAPDFWTFVQTPGPFGSDSIIERETDPEFVKVGSFAAKITMGNASGSTASLQANDVPIAVTPGDAKVSGGATINLSGGLPALADASVSLTVAGTTKTLREALGVAADAAVAAGLYTLIVADVDVTGETEIDFRINIAGHAAILDPIYVNAVAMLQGSVAVTPFPWVDGAHANKLWHAARQLFTDGAQYPRTEYRLSLLRLDRIDGATWGAKAPVLGGVMRTADSDLRTITFPRCLYVDEPDDSALSDIRLGAMPRVASTALANPITQQIIKNIGGIATTIIRQNIFVDAGVIAQPGPPGPTGPAAAGLLSGAVAPNGAVAASPGTVYAHLAAGGGFWRKVTGTGNTGWARVDQLITLPPPSGDETTDDAEIDAAISAASAFTHGALILLDKCPDDVAYKWGTNKLLPHGVGVLGHGMRASRIEWSGTGYLFKCGTTGSTSAEGISLNGFSIYCTDDDGHAIWVIGTTNFQADRIYVEGQIGGNTVLMLLDGGDASNIFTHVGLLEGRHVKKGVVLGVEGSGSYVTTARFDQLNVFADGAAGSVAIESIPSNGDGVVFDMVNAESCALALSLKGDGLTINHLRLEDCDEHIEFPDSTSGKGVHINEAVGLDPDKVTDNSGSGYDNHRYWGCRKADFTPFGDRVVGPVSRRAFTAAEHVDDVVLYPTHSGMARRVLNSSGDELWGVTKDGYTRVNGIQVVGAQGAAIANPTDAASTMARLIDVLGALRAHGLIDT